MSTRSNVLLVIVVTVIIGACGYYFLSGIKTPVAQIFSGRVIKLRALQEEPGTGIVFDCDGTLTINSKNDITGGLQWRIHAIKDVNSTYGKQYGPMLTEMATEYVKGTFDPATNSLTLHGYDISGPPDFIQKTDYVLQILPAIHQMTGKCTDSKGGWSGLMYNMTYEVN
jgi:hypothetical protein